MLYLEGIGVATLVLVTVAALMWVTKFLVTEGKQFIMFQAGRPPHGRFTCMALLTLD